ncbi:hypothetical protein JL09_g6857, partial [Pichia kudriavzevii]
QGKSSPKVKLVEIVKTEILEKQQPFTSACGNK